MRSQICHLRLQKTQTIIYMYLDDFTGCKVTLHVKTKENVVLERRIDFDIDINVSLILQATNFVDGVTDS